MDRGGAHRRASHLCLWSQSNYPVLGQQLAKVTAGITTASWTQRATSGVSLWLSTRRDSNESDTLFMFALTDCTTKVKPVCGEKLDDSEED
jgi:hypothetical protein